MASTIPAFYTYPVVCLIRPPADPRTEFLNKLARKWQPYYPAHRPQINFNGRVTTLTQRFGLGIATVWCRHLALSYALEKNKSSFLKSLINQPNIFHGFKFKLKQLDNILNRITSNNTQPHKQLIDGQSLGLYLKTIAQALPINGESNILLETENHLLAANLRHKIKKATSYFALRLYDPNITTNHIRCLARTPDDLAPIGLNSLIPPQALKDYGENGQHSLALTAILLTPLHNLHAARIHRTISAQALHLAFKHNHPDLALQYTRHILDHPKISVDDKITLLRAHDQDEAPGLHEAFYQGRSILILQFSQAILQNTQLNDSEKTVILTARHPDGISGPHAALYNNQTATVCHFAALILSSEHVSPEAKANILAVPSAHNTPHTTAWQAFKTLIERTTHLTFAHKSQILPSSTATA